MKGRKYMSQEITRRDFIDAMRERWFFRIVVAGVGLACLSILVVVGQGNSEAAKLKNPVPQTEESVAAGKKVYAG